MRLNKKKLAALAMSAVMAASTMPFPVLAEEFTDMGEATVAEQETPVSGETATSSATATFDVEYDENGCGSATSVTISYYDGTESVTKYGTDIKTVVKQSQTCLLPEKVVFSVYDDHTNQWLHTPDSVNEWIKTKNELGHGETKTEWRYVETTDAGDVMEKHTFCSVCGEDLTPATGGEKKTVPHEYGEEYFEIVNLRNLDENLQLIDKTQKGYYDKKWYHDCKNEGCSYQKVPVRTESNIEVLRDTDKQVKKIIATVDSNSNILSGISNNQDVTAGLPSDDSIVLKNCYKNGTYKITAYSSETALDDAHILYTETHVIAASNENPHHAEYVEYKAVKPSEQSLLTNVYDKAGKLIGVKNTSCDKSKTVEYKKIVKCSTENNKVISEEKGIALPEGNHANVSKAASLTWIENHAPYGYASAADFKEILKESNQKAQNYKVSVSGDCEKEAVVTITYLCDKCGEAFGDTVTVKCKDTALKHSWSAPARVNVVDPTCSKEGSYDTEKTCSVCGKKEVVSTGNKIGKTKHSFDEGSKGLNYTNTQIKFTGTKVVDTEGENLSRIGKAYTNNLVTSYLGYGVSAKPVIKCETCGEMITPEGASEVTLTVKDIQKETAKQAGSITIRATWYTPVTTASPSSKLVEATYTVPYFSTVAAYLERNPEEEPLNGLVKDVYGVWRYFEDGEFQKDFTGIVDYEGGRFFVANGVLCSDASGLNLYNGEWYFLAGGQIQTQVTGLAMYNGEWFFLTNGKLDRSKSGLVEYDGAKFIVAKGELQRYSGLWQDPADGTWYFAALGQIQEQYTGTAIYDGQTFELVNGKLVR